MNTARNIAIVSTVTTLLAVPTMTLADEVQLHSHDGSLHITGEFLEYDPKGFLIDTPLGELLISSALVTCEGHVCPSVEQVHTDLQSTGYVLADDTTSSIGTPSQKPQYCPHSLAALG